jgi:hypothetical protein
MSAEEYQQKLRVIVEQAWDGEIRWPEIEAWVHNFTGESGSAEDEQRLALLMLTRFMYFSKGLVRQMLKAVYRDQIESPIKQRIRRNCGNTRDFELVQRLYNDELASTRFIGVGNPAESGAHLLYYFRQVNYLKKDLFSDVAGAFVPSADRTGQIIYKQREAQVARYVFFDDLVGSGTQATQYLKPYIKLIRENSPGVELRFVSLFATTSGLEKLSASDFFGKDVTTLFELDDTYKAFGQESRYFNAPPDWFSLDALKNMCSLYGGKLNPGIPLGYKDGQLLLGFSHNTPDNVPPVFWNEGRTVPWRPIFVRYDKKY